MDTHEFEHVRAAVQKAGAIVREAMQEHCAERWDFLIVAVPPFDPQEKGVTLGVMTSVTPQELPDFAEYIRIMLLRSFTRGTWMDERTSPGKPS